MLKKLFILNNNYFRNFDMLKHLELKQGKWRVFYIIYNTVVELSFT